MGKTLDQQVRAAFEEMKQAELKMDDMDILMESPLFQKAMAAAQRWHELLDQQERELRGQP